MPYPHADACSCHGTARALSALPATWGAQPHRGQPQARICRTVTTNDLRQPDREHLSATLRTLLPYLQNDTAISPTHGGRAAALERLAKIKPEAYERSRNYLSGDVTRLSAYLRHGVLTLAEVRDYALQHVADPARAGKLVNEFAWRDYWQRLYVELGEGIWQDREPYKTGFSAKNYAEQLPEDIAGRTTTLTCMDSFSDDLRTTGYLHNHARLWFASYIVHWRRTRWQAGARWFLEHLIDGDPASNNLSWQWVASTFSSQPYIFNRENLQRYTNDTYCSCCPHATAGTCPFDQDYESLEQTFFPQLHQRVDNNAAPTPSAPYVKPTVHDSRPNAQGKPLLWHHTDSLNPAAQQAVAHGNAPAVFVWDTGWLIPNHITLKRVQFLAECLAEMPGTIDLHVGEPAEQLLAAAQAAGADYILAQRTPDPRLNATADQVSRTIPVVWYDTPAFVESSRGFDLKRFSRYWKRAQFAAMQPTR